MIQLTETYIYKGNPINWCEPDGKGVAPQLTSTQSVVPSVVPTAPVAERPQRRIIEIKVFYDDGTFQTFS